MLIQGRWMLLLEVPIDAIAGCVLFFIFEFCDAGGDSFVLERGEGHVLVPFFYDTRPL